MRFLPLGFFLLLASPILADEKVIEVEELVDFVCAKSTTGTMLQKAKQREEIAKDGMEFLADRKCVVRFRVSNASKSKQFDGKTRGKLYGRFVRENGERLMPKGSYSVTSALVNLDLAESVSIGDVVLFTGNVTTKTTDHTLQRLKDGGILFATVHDSHIYLVVEGGFSASIVSSGDQKNPKNDDAQDK